MEPRAGLLTAGTDTVTWTFNTSKDRLFSRPRTRHARSPKLTRIAWPSSTASGSTATTLAGVSRRVDVACRHVGGGVGLGLAPAAGFAADGCRRRRVGLVPLPIHDAARRTLPERAAVVSLERHA